MATKNTRAARSTKRSNNESADGNGLWPRLAWLATAAAWTFVVASLASFDPADSPTHAVYPPNEVTSNLCGPIGAAIAYQGYALLGWAAWLPMAVVAWVLILPVLNRPTGSYAFRGLGTVLLTAAGCGSLALMFATSGPLPELAGGKLGYVFAGTLVESFGRFGSFLWLLLAAAIGLVVGFDRLALGLPMAVYRGIARTLAKPTGKKPAKKSKADPGVAAGAVGGLLAGVAAFFAKLAGAGKSKPAKKKRRRAHDLDGRPTTPVEAGDAEAEDEYEDEQAEWDEAAEADDEEWEYEDEEDGEYEYEEEDEAADEAAEVVAGADDDEEEEDELPGAPQILAEDQLRDKMAKLPVRFAGATRKLATEEDLRDLQVQAELKGYRYPGIDILEDPEEDFSASLEAIVREQATNLESALQEYRIKGEVVGIESGPVITQFDVRLAPGTKVSKLQAVSTDIARSLRAVNVRIVGNQAGRDTVGVEVPNPKKEKVRLKELMADRERFADMKLPMFLGKDAAGDPLIEDLTKMPHMLIAGTTGSGKSVCMNTIIMSWLYTKKPNELKMVLVDPKMVEMSQFKDIPHLMCPVITEMAKAAAILEWACKKMDERYELLADAGCRDISSYNELDFDEICERMGIENEQDRARVPQRLPYMVFIIDELADLMMTNKEVEGSIIRIAQKARAVGIHLILATQRPQANVVTGLIKSNMPCRVTFKVASGMDSRIVLDQKGGELLLGQGDMLYLSPRSSKLKRCQGTLVDDHEIRKVVRFMRDVAKPTFERQLVQLRGPGGSDEERIMASENNSSASLKAAQEDPMFDRAVEIVLETQRGSVSLLQRRLAIGYTRASRLIDLMGIAQIIGEHKGSVAREVLIGPDDWARMKEMADDQARAAGETPVFSSGESPQAEAGLFGDEAADVADAAAEESAAEAIEEPPFDIDDGPAASGEVEAKPMDSELGVEDAESESVEEAADAEAELEDEAESDEEDWDDGDADGDDENPESSDDSDDPEASGEDEEWEEEGEWEEGDEEAEDGEWDEEAEWEEAEDSDEDGDWEEEEDKTAEEPRSASTS